MIKKNDLAKKCKRSTGIFCQIKILLNEWIFKVKINSLLRIYSENL